MQIHFETLGVMGLSIQPAHISAMIASGMITGITVCCGHSTTSVGRFQDGKIIGVRREAIGSNDTWRLLQELNPTGGFWSGQERISAGGTSQRLRHTPAEKRAEESAAKPKVPSEERYRLPDNHSVLSPCSYDWPQDVNPHVAAPASILIDAHATLGLCPDIQGAGKNYPMRGAAAMVQELLSLGAYAALVLALTVV